MAHQVPDGVDADNMRKLALDVRSRIPHQQPAVVALIGTPADRPVVVIAVNEPARGLGLSAGALVAGAAKALGGGGGGKPDIAQGGGAAGAGADAINTAFQTVRSALQDSGTAGR